MNTQKSPPKAALHRAVDVLGGQSALAAAIGCDRRVVWHWFSGERQVPAEKCPLIEDATRKAGAVVKCEELRPDVSWGVLRRRSATQGA